MPSGVYERTEEHNRKISESLKGKILFNERGGKMIADEWIEWKTRKTTQEYLKLVKEEINKIQEGIGRGNCLNTDSTDNTAMMYSKGAGIINGLERAINIIEILTKEEE